MASVTLSLEDYAAKVYGCWLGKNIGGTLGGPHEGRKGLNSLTYYDPVPEEPAFNDDLDLQLVWLYVLEKKGLDLTPWDLGEAWKRHIIYPFDEYGFGLRNLKRGLGPPVSGWFDNWFTCGMGAPIRSEIWACIAPGLPEVAARYAWQDALCDHAEDGVYGEVFFAAMESAAFICAAREELLEIGLAMIPEESRTARAVRNVMRSHAEGLEWTAARERMLTEFGHHNFTDAPQNIAITMLGWLYGEDFGDALLKAVNCGYDTDCTGATLGAILGIIGGKEALPRRWVEPVGEAIKVGWGVVKCEAPESLEELTARTVAIGQEVVRRHSARIELSDTAGTDVGCMGKLDLRRSEEVRELYAPRRQDLVCRPVGKWDVCLRYGLDASIHPGQRKRVEVTIVSRRDQQSKGYVTLRAPDGWTVEPVEQRPWLLPRQGDRADFEYLVTAPGDATQLDISNPLSVVFEPFDRRAKEVEFALIGAALWKIVGPFYAYEDPRAEVFGPEETLSVVGGDLPCQELWVSGNAVDLNPWLGARPNGVAYAQCYVKSPQRRKARLIVSCDAGFKAWLNGELVLDTPQGRPIIPAGHRSGPGSVAEATLNEGYNSMLLKVVRGRSPVALHFFITDQKKHQYPDLCATHWPEVAED